MKRSKLAFLWSAEYLLGRHCAALWTITTMEAVSYDMFRDMWRKGLNALRKICPSLSGIRVFEVHPAEYSHGLHVHMLTVKYHDWALIHHVLLEYGFGRVDVQRVKRNEAMPCYLAKYLSKCAGEKRCWALKGWRMWAPIAFPSYIRTTQVVVDSLVARVFRMYYKRGESFAALPFADKQDVAESYARRVKLDQAPLPCWDGSVPAWESDVASKARVYHWRSSGTAKQVYLGMQSPCPAPVKAQSGAFSFQHFALPHPAGKNNGYSEPLPN